MKFTCHALIRVLALTLMVILITAPPVTARNEQGDRPDFRAMNNDGPEGDHPDGKNPDSLPPRDPGPSWFGFAVQPEGGFLMARVILPMESLGQKKDNVRGPQLILLLEKEDYFMVEGKLQLAEVTGEAVLEPEGENAPEGRMGNDGEPDGPPPPQLVSVSGKLSATPYWRPETMLDMQNDPEGTKAAGQFKGKPQIVGSIELKSEIRMERIHVLTGTIEVDGQTWQLYAAPPPPPPGQGRPGERRSSQGDPGSSGNHPPQGQQ